MKLVNPQQLLEHRKTHRTGTNRNYIVFTVNFKTGDITKSRTNVSLDQDLFICERTGKKIKSFKIAHPNIHTNA